MATDQHARPLGVVRVLALSATLASLCQAANSPPVLSKSTFTLPPISEDDTTGLGFQLYGQVNGFYSDPDSGDNRGIAIVGADASDGHWEYALDSTVGTPTWTPIGSVSDTHALLLAYGVAGYSGITALPAALRFVPNHDFNGVIASALSFRAWDETSGGPASGAAPSYGDTTAGGTAFSSLLGVGSLTVMAVNDAPTLDTSGDSHLDPAVYGAVSATGTRIVDLLATGAGGMPLHDVDAGDFQGIAIIDADTTFGSWEFTANGPTNWQSLPAVSPGNALLLNVGAYHYGSGTDTRLRFVPSNSGFTGTITAAITFRAWDQSDSNTAGFPTNASTVGGSTAFSINAETASISVTGLPPGPVAPVVFPEPPVSTGSVTRYGAVCPGTPQGVTSLRDAVFGRPPNEARVFTWDAFAQAFVELPTAPTGGFRPDTGFFLATRAALPIDFHGTLSAIPYVLTLRPGWNLVGVPPLDDGSGGIDLSHPWDDFELVDETATAITSPAVFTDILGTPGGATASARPWYWDGSGYQQVTTLESGKAYWLKNNASSPMSLWRMSASVLPTGRLVRPAASTAGGAHGAIVDRGTPPPPPGAAAAVGSGRGCAPGSAIGLLALGLLAALRGLGRRR